MRLGDRMTNVNVPTFVKWAGGKTRLVPELIQHLPKHFNNYFEPFVGSGALFFYIAKHIKPKKMTISDINKELIETYEVVKDNYNGLVKKLKEHKVNHNKEYYYKLRKQDPATLSKTDRVARFIYLNKTCFNGLYRVNSKGGFNVPMGSYKNPSVFHEDKLRNTKELLKNVKILNASFETVLKMAEKGDFIYFDPPYYPLKKGQSFTTYTKENFLEKEQEQLANVFDELSKRGCFVMLSNSDTTFIKSLYKRYSIHVIKANRMINCDGSNRGKINELIIVNYPLQTIQKKL
jgi:DNA adenine methylase